VFSPHPVREGDGAAVPIGARSPRPLQLIAAGWRRHASFPHVCDFPKARLLASHRFSDRSWKRGDSPFGSMIADLISRCPRHAPIRTRIRKSAWFRCAFCRGTASAAADAPTSRTAPFCSSGICVERASNQVVRLERRLPIFEFGLECTSSQSEIHAGGHLNAPALERQ
jgi:hypothetical protein